MKIIILGGTGLIGKALTDRWKNKYELIVFTRNPGKNKDDPDKNLRYIYWNGLSIKNEDLKYFKGDYVIINFVGESISGLWTKRYKNRILSSRINSVKVMISTIERTINMPQVIVQASAIGFYGYNIVDIVDERSNKGKGFLADVNDMWEKATTVIDNLGIRLVIIRTGVVLTDNGGFLQLLKKQVKYRMALIPGSGKQFLSWIDIVDEVRAIEFLITNNACKGVYNLTSPKPVSISVLYKKMAKGMNRKIIGRVPAWILKILLGKMATELFLSDQKVVPTRLLNQNFTFDHPEISTSLEKYF